LSWLVLDLVSDKKNLSLLEEVLFANGAISITLKDHKNKDIYEFYPEEFPLWDEINLTAIFDLDVCKKFFLVEILNSLKISNFHFTKLDNQNWIKKFQDSNVSKKFGKNLFVVPSWEKAPSSPNSVFLRLDPGLAFGSGSHETTSLCLNYLDENKPIEKTVIDYGCGSGIIGLSAIKLGAKYLYSVDIDQKAIDTTLENAKKNKIENSISVFKDKLPSKIKADLIFANILLNPLMQLQETFYKLMTCKSKLILSGFTDVQNNTLRQEYNKKFIIKKEVCMNGWSLFELKKRCYENHR